jgi:two-component system, NtrC family, response regulator GlrR
MTFAKGATQALSVLGARSWKLSSFRLAVLGGPDAPRVHNAVGDTVVIGSDPSCQLVLTDPTVSRFHCELTVKDGRVRVRDLGSRNGTVVDKVAVEVGFLQDGATLRLGNSDVRFELTATQIELPVSTTDTFGLLVGRSAAMRRTFSLLEGAAKSDAAVLLLGETGTGKDAAACSLHQASARAKHPFVVVDCSAIPAELLESELFGHERGAFTGAHQAKAGLFESAQGGTLLLDEVGELPLGLQPKLLGVLERREIKRVGGTTPIPIDVRIVAATNRDLRTEVNERRFRADLFYRLAVVEIPLPPLRDRLEDLPLLTAHLLARFEQYPQALLASLAEPTFIEALAGHRWPGNVRELRNHLERCLVLRDTSVSLQGAAAKATPHDQALPDTSLPLKEARADWTRTLERRYVETLLARHDGNVAAAARGAGVDRMYFYRLLWRYGLRGEGSEQ